MHYLPLVLPLGPKGKWQPDLDWLIANEASTSKVAEGKYDWRMKDAQETPAISEEDINSSELFASWLGITRTAALDQIAVKNNADEISLVDIKSAIDKTKEASGIESRYFNDECRKDIPQEIEIYTFNELNFNYESLIARKEIRAELKKIEEFQNEIY